MSRENGERREDTLRIQVVLCSDDPFAPFVATTIASILLHTEEHVDFTIFSLNISENHKRGIEEIGERFANQTIRFLEIDEGGQLADCPPTKYVSRAMYARFLIPELLPDAGRVIYSDVDVAFTGDIRVLWNESLGGYALGAVPNPIGPWIKADECRRLPIDRGHVLFNSGLLLFDCARWRRENWTARLLDFARTLDRTGGLCDQDVFNCVFSPNRYKPLDDKYCVMYKRRDCFSAEAFERLRQEQIIVHYPGPLNWKPWINPDLESAEFFWNVVPMTAFEEEIRGKRGPARWYNEMKDFLADIKSAKLVVLYGAGEVGSLAARYLKRSNLSRYVFAVTDNEWDLKVATIDTFVPLRESVKVVITAMDDLQPEMQETLERLGFPCIIPLNQKLRRQIKSEIG